jgi:RNA polymerase sigma-70 factor, ECF subfamily
MLTVSLSANDEIASSKSSQANPPVTTLSWVSNRRRRRGTPEYYCCVPISPDLAFLLEAVAEGDNRAAETFVRQTQGAVWRLCRALGSGDDFDDLVQETYLRVFRSLSLRNPDGNVMAWLLTISRCVCADAVRIRRRDRNVNERAITEFSRDHPPEPTHVAVLLDDINAERREAFVLTQIVGLSYDEAAAVCQCPVGTIRSRVARARRDLVTAEIASQRNVG